ncbi:oligosaccharide flippase family protein [Paraburkholderia edwinii]|uniref:Oligosaccharide flippase family protein n=1 Tax=Paraburkholderia edwinii TaxID=2861782 RepID=A0ABX8UR48_9BURK|nr:phosphoribosylaminoimidazole carboxylase [Paraburkholderia edwinii]QYD71460.1 oligosaccharide flippase family protein [Paraburkholderia edwinii]
MWVRLFLRVVSLGAKFLLTVVIARTLGFAAVADYGLAVAASVVASKVLGLGFSAELNRRLSAAEPGAAIHSARRLRGVYCIAYLAIAALGYAVWQSVRVDVERIGAPGVLIAVMLVAFAEHYALEANSYLFSLHRTQAASVMLFARTGGWAVLAVAGLLAGVIDDIQPVLWLWIGANACVIVGAWVVIESMAREATPANRGDAGMRGVFASGAAFYVATILLSATQYAERFIATPYLSADTLGRYVFTWSIANAVQTITYAALIVTAGPRLAKTAAVAPQQFRAVLSRALVRTTLLALIISFGIAALCNVLFGLAHQPTDRLGLETLLILLASFVLRSVTDLLWAASIALRQGMAVAFGTAVLLMLSSLSTWWLAVHLSMPGLALAHLGTSVFVAGWLGWVVGSRLPSTSPAAASQTGDRYVA